MNLSFLRDLTAALEGTTTATFECRSEPAPHSNFKAAIKPYYVLGYHLARQILARDREAFLEHGKRPDDRLRLTLPGVATAQVWTVRKIEELDVIFKNLARSDAFWVKRSDDGPDSATLYCRHKKSDIHVEINCRGDNQLFGGIFG